MPEVRDLRGLVARENAREDEAPHSGALRSLGVSSRVLRRTIARPAAWLHAASGDGGGPGADEELLLEDDDAGCEGARSGPGSRGSIERAGCVGARGASVFEDRRAPFFLRTGCSRSQERETRAGSEKGRGAG